MKKIMFNDKYCLTQAVLEGRKTMTRRFINGDYTSVIISEGKYLGVIGNGKEYIRLISKYKVGDEVAVAQSYDSFYDDSYDPRIFPAGAGWTNKMFVKADLMKHFIHITSVKVERLQDISDEDCLKEGVELNTRQYEYDGTRCYCVRGLGHWRAIGCTNFGTPREAFSVLIDKVSGKGIWESNPLVWVYEFELTD